MYPVLIRPVDQIRLVLVALVLDVALYLEAVTGIKFFSSARRGSSVMDKLFLFIICYIAAVFFQEIVLFFVPSFGEPLNTLFGIVVGATIFFIVLRKYNPDLDD